jgi:outer membrane protein assembly factor BamE (lipoprotein component of BamABCDE complex)
MIERHLQRRYLDHDRRGWKRSSLRLLAAGTVMAALAGCSFPISDRGNLPKADLLSQVKPGVTDKASVKALLGTPSSIATFDGDTWYYISREEKQVAFLKPEVMNQQVYAVHFDDKGIVDGLTHKGMQDAQNMTPNPDATPAPGREFTFLEQLIGNFGKFNGGGSGNGATPGGPPTGGGS